MTKMTIATDEHGSILGAVQHVEEKTRDGMQAVVSFAPGSRLHVVEIGPELDLKKVSDVSIFHDELSRYVPSAK